MQGKGGVFYDCLTHVPLIFSWPGQIPAGERDGSLVSLLDIVPTILRLQGLPIPDQMQGQLLPTITPTQPRGYVISTYGAGGPPFRLADLDKMPPPYGRRAFLQSLQWREAEGLRKMIRTHNWKYVHDPMGDKDELYDLANDPWELYNLAESPIYQEVVKDLYARYDGWRL